MQINLLDDDGWSSAAGPPSGRGSVAAERVAGAQLGASLYELPPGESTFPYHYELGNDELLVVVSGRPTLRSPDGRARAAARRLHPLPERPRRRTPALEQLGRADATTGRVGLRAPAGRRSGRQQQADGPLGLGRGRAQVVLPRRRRGLLGWRGGRIAASPSRQRVTEPASGRGAASPRRARRARADLPLRPRQRRPSRGSSRDAGCRE